MENTVIGIQTEIIDNIFKHFRQINEANSGNFDGTGLGLIITKKIVELLGRNVYVTAKLGIGSKLIIKFPKKEIKMEENNGNYSVLLVENDIPSIDIIKIYLQEKYIVDAALDGLSALQMLEKKKYDAILMDIDLGFGMDGLEVAQKIREMQDYENIPIIAVTAYGTVGDREKFLSAGCTHYIAKPFDKFTLMELLDEIF